MARGGICVAGNLIVDVLYEIDGYPPAGELTTIRDIAGRSTGGLVCNCIVDMAKLDSDIPLTALGVVGDDAEGRFVLSELQRYTSIDVSRVAVEGATSFTAVMNDGGSGTRTFFQYRGANALFSQRHVDFGALDIELLHIGYILLLDALDGLDAEFGTRMARLLHDAQARGIRTSIDVVTESGDRFARVVRPALRYCDYCVINEIEAERITGVPLRAIDGSLDVGRMPEALVRLHEMGVSTWCVIHAPEHSCGRDERGNIVSLPGVRLPQGYIKGTVGAGDAFCSGVLVGAWQGKPLQQAMELGTAAAICSLGEADASSGVCAADEALLRYRQFSGN